MSQDTTKIVIDPRRQIRVNKIKLPAERIDEFFEVIARAYEAKKPKKEDLQVIRKFLIDYPQMCKLVFGIVESVQSLIVKNMAVDQEVVHVAIEEYLVSIRNDFGYHDAPIMEQLLIENIVTAWLRVQFCETQLAFRMNGEQRMSVMEFWERRLSMAQRRYLAACETLAKIRKMSIPAVQLNIGDQQINVAGNLPTPKSTD